MSATTAKHVKGVLFVDYVRMVRTRKDIDWSQRLSAENLAWVHREIDPDGWYPMAVFEALGTAILDVFGVGNVELARLWGHQSVELLVDKNPLLCAPDDPVETLNRVRVLRSTYFDFEAMRFAMILEDELLVILDYGMQPGAEEAACYQTLGFFEALLGRAGGTDIVGDFFERSWAGDSRTAISYRWTPPG